jgi:asparagine synthase (glutamine-hydrolysing)
LQDSVKCQLISDVKVGCQLSGGIDSSLVSYWAARQQGGLFDSISIKFQNPEFSEEPYIDYVNQSLGLVGHKATLELDFILEHLNRATWHYDFPVTQPNCLGIYLLSQQARKHVTVLLSGEGADEVFGGYRRFYDAAWLARFVGIPGMLSLSKIKRRLAPFGSVDEKLVGLLSFCDPAQIMRIYPDFNLQQALARRFEIWHATQDSTLLERQLTYEQRTYLVELLMRQDKMCMAHGIENRVPMLDHRIVELAKRIPTRLKVSTPLVPRRGRSVYHTKSILKQMAAKIYGQSFAYRPKSVFALPLHELFASRAFRAAYPEYRNALRDLGAFDLAEVDALYRASCENPGAHANLLWNLIALGAWLLVFRKTNALNRHFQL